MPLWSDGRAGAVDAYDAQRGLARLKAGLGFATQPRTITAGRYEIQELTGAGGFGRVYRAHDPELERDVALKAIPVSQSNATEAHRVARAEAQTLAGLSHPNIIKVYDIFVAPRPSLDGAPSPTSKRESDLFIVMPFIRGRTLDDWVADTQPPEESIVDAYVQAARGLAAAHRAGLVHRDFKPSNAMREDDGRVVVLDFGVATVYDAGGAPSFDAIPNDLPVEVTVRSIHHRNHGGTPAYMAPEQHEAREVSPATDVYAFGVSLFEALTGHRPFRGDSVLELWQAKVGGKLSMPRTMDRGTFGVIERALAPDPLDRWPSMQTMLDALLAARSRRRRKVRNGVAVVALAAAALGMIVLDSESVDCDATGEALTERWADSRRELARSLRDAEVPPGPRVSLLAHLDEFVTDWAVADAHLCRAETTPLSARARPCLDGARDAMWARVESATQSPEGARTAASHEELWPQVTACSNDELVRLDPLPDDPGALAQIDRLNDWLHQPVSADATRDELDARIEQARKTGHQPTLASTLMLAGEQTAARGDLAAAKEYLEASFTAASDGGADRLALSAAVSVSAVAANVASLEETQRWVRTALALCDRLEDTGRMRAAANKNLAVALVNVRRFDEAIESAEQALTYTEQAGASDAYFVTELYHLASAVQAKARNPELAVQYGEEALRRAQQQFADDHTLLNRISNALAVAQHGTGNIDEAERLLRSVIERPQTLPRDRYQAASNLALFLDDAGRRQDALDLLGELIDGLTERDSVGVGNLIGTRGIIAGKAGRIEQARRDLHAARAIYEAHLPPDHVWITSLDRRLERLERLERLDATANNGDPSPGATGSVVAGSDP